MVGCTPGFLSIKIGKDLESLICCNILSLFVRFIQTSKCKKLIFILMRVLPKLFDANQTQTEIILMLSENF